MVNFLFGLASPFAYLIIFGFLILCGVGNPLPEDTILIAGGYLAYAGVIKIYYILAICYLGIICGDVMLYHIGKKYGQRIIEHPKFLRLIPEKRVHKIRKGFQKWGHWMVFFARFLVGFRSPTFLLAGIMRFRFKEFIIFDCLGALISVPLFIGLGYLFGANVDALREDLGRIKSWIVIVVLLLIAAFIIWRWYRSKKPDTDLKAPFLWKEEHGGTDESQQDK